MFINVRPMVDQLERGQLVTAACPDRVSSQLGQQPHRRRLQDLARYSRSKTLRPLHDDHVGARAGQQQRERQPGRPATYDAEVRW